ncbi:MAG: pyridoxamine 5'-phosphate oxidase family protein [Promethearchaeota archaeon]
MFVRELPFNYVEKKLRKKKFGFLGTITPEGSPHVAGVMYAVSPPQEKLYLYIITSTDTKKARNIRINPRISFAIPFPHYILRFPPDFCIQFQGCAEILSFNDPDGQEAIRSRRLMKRMLRKIPLDTTEEIIIRISPDKKIFGFGLGMNIFKLVRNIESGRFFTIIPDKLLPV